MLLPHRRCWLEFRLPLSLSHTTAAAPSPPLHPHRRSSLTTDFQRKETLLGLATQSAHPGSNVSTACSSLSQPWRSLEEEFNKYDREPAKYIKQYKGIKPRTGTPYSCDIGYERFLGPEHSFLKQFYGSVTKSDYIVLRLGFVMTHCRGNPKFNFHKYMIHALEDFEKVVGISWYLWIFVIFLLLNVNASTCCGN